MLNNKLGNGLCWYPSKGVGYLEPDADFHYDEAYAEEYRRRGDTQIGRSLNLYRTELVEEFDKGPVLDFGCGTGDFIRTRGVARTFGYDVIESTVSWLLKENLYRTPWDFDGSVTFWDSLEHLLEPEKVLSTIKGHLFISMPTYRDYDDVLRSKHFKPNEHIWYWTDWGLMKWVESVGFEFLKSTWGESDLGREGIQSFVFKRKGD